MHAGAGTGAVDVGRGTGEGRGAKRGVPQFHSRGGGMRRNAEMGDLEPARRSAIYSNFFLVSPPRGGRGCRRGAVPRAPWRRACARGGYVARRGDATESARVVEAAAWWWWWWWWMGRRGGVRYNGHLASCVIWDDIRSAAG